MAGLSRVNTGASVSHRCRLEPSPLKSRAEGAEVIWVTKRVNIDVPRTWFVAGAFPLICARTGTPTDLRRSMNADRNPPVVWLGLVGGLLGVFLMQSVFRVRVAGSVPLVSGGGSTNRLMLGAAMFLGGMISMIGIPSGIGVLVVIGLLGFPVSIAGLIVAFRSTSPGIKLVLSDDGRWVTMKGVHPRFARATLALLAEAQSSVSQPTGPFYSPWEAAC